MVDALQRARRWLRPGGFIIDIHPTADPARLAIQTANDVVFVGELEDLDNGCGPDGRHARAEAALRQALGEGWLALDGRRDVTFLHEADSLAGMLDHINVEWRNARFAPAAVERASALLRAHPDARVVLEEDITLSRLRPAVRADRSGPA